MGLDGSGLERFGEAVKAGLLQCVTHGLILEDAFFCRCGLTKERIVERYAQQGIARCTPPQRSHTADAIRTTQRATDSLRVRLRVWLAESRRAASDLAIGQLRQLRLGETAVITRPKPMPYFAICG